MTDTTKPISILLVDDDEINNFISIKLIKKALVYTEITACLDGGFAIDQLLETQQQNPGNLPDYILLDINMPRMNGWEFLEEYERLRIDPLNKSRIFIVSSSVFSNDIDKAKSYPLVKDFVSKPLNVDKIRELFGVEKTV